MTSSLQALARQHRSWAAVLLAALVGSAAAAAPVYRVIELGGLFSKGWSTAQAINARGEVVGSAMPRPIGPYHPPAHPVLFRQRKPLDLIVATGVDADEGHSTDINSDGHVAGYLRMNRDGSYRPFVYRQGTMEVVDARDYAAGSPVRLSDLGHLLMAGDVDGKIISSVRQPDGRWVSLKPWKNRDMAIGRAINRQGSIVVGHASDFYGQPQALVWRDARPQRVPGTEHGNLGSTASAVNDRGDIAGQRVPRGGHGERAYLVRDGVLTDLTGPDLASVATGLDNLGRVVGHVLDDPRGAFLFQEGQTMFLNDLVEPAQQGQWQILEAWAIHDSGEIAAWGRSTLTHGEHAVKLVPVTAR